LYRYTKAQNNLGSLYYSGNGVALDPAAAAAWYAKGAVQGNASALNNLAICHEDGVGTARDLARARALYAAAVGAHHSLTIVHVFTRLVSAVVL
jgi:TPR repeat protein